MEPRAAARALAGQLRAGSYCVLRLEWLRCTDILAPSATSDGLAISWIWALMAKDLRGILLE